MNFTYEQLARINTMVGIALMSGKVDMDEISESIHKKISNELCRQENTKVVIGMPMEKKSYESE